MTTTPTWLGRYKTRCFTCNKEWESDEAPTTCGPDCGSESILTEQEAVTIIKDTPFPPDSVLIELAAGALGFGLNPTHVDWDRFWDSLEDYGLDMQIHQESKYKRRVRQLIKEGEVAW